jgi:hypothetical protein
MSPGFIANLLSVVTAAPLPQASYQWKFEAGRTFYVEQTIEVRQEMTVSGTLVKQTQFQVFTLALTPERQLADGSWSINQRILGVRMNLDVGGNKIDFDSAVPDKEATPLSDFMRILIGAEFRFQLDRNKGVVAVEGRDEFVKRMVDARPEMKALLQTMLSESALKEMCGQTFVTMPNRVVPRGDGWQRSSRIDLGPIGSYDSTHRYTSLGPKGAHDAFQVEVTEMRYQPPAKGVEGLPFKIVSADLRGTGREGEMLFDRKRGRVERSEISLKLHSTMTIEVGGQETKVELKQEQKSITRTLDANPLEK